MTRSASWPPPAPNVPEPTAWSLSVLPPAASAPPTAVSAVAITFGLQSCFARNPPTSAVPAAPSAVYARRPRLTLSSGVRGARGARGRGGDAGRGGPPLLRYLGLDFCFFFFDMDLRFRLRGGCEGRGT